jgi:thiamine-monophosphate kinase
MSGGTVDEREAIRILLAEIGQPRAPISAIGDDVAVLPTGKGRLVIKTDMLVRQTDVPPQMTLTQAARKAIVMCVSDFAAKGVQPAAALISLGLPRGLSEGDVRDLGRGFGRASAEFGCPIVGGDTNEAADLIIDCVLVGFAPDIIRRDSARPGDVVAVSGPFGYSASGLHILLEGGPVQTRFQRVATAAVLEPRAALSLGIALREAALPSAAIDSSDGLAWSLYELAWLSKVGVELDRLPQAPGIAQFAAAHDESMEDLVLYGGEEYEIVATFPPSKFPRARALAKRYNRSLEPIGRVRASHPQVWRRIDERRIPVDARGWVHLK